MDATKGPKKQGSKQKEITKPAVDLLQITVDNFEDADQVPLFKLPYWLEPENIQMIQDHFSR